jgi:flagellar protein FliS
MNPVRAYLDTQKKTASKERVMVMLFEAAQRHIRVGADALERGARTPALSPLGKASEIIEYLASTLDPRHDAELCARLDEVYGFVLARLAVASTAYDAAAAREAERVFAPVAASFTAAVARLEQKTVTP